MTTNSTRGRLLASSMICGVAFATLAGAVAQAAAAPEVQEVVVTGSRIQVPGLATSSPVTSIGQAEFKFQQAPEAEQLLRNLPATVPGDGANVNNGTAGVATVNLRGLGAQRTLVLIDGKRMIPYNVNGVVDISNIPVSMLDRVDVVTGGASAVYGSDAVAGAVNFVLKKNFEGLEIRSQYGISGDHDGKDWSVDAVMGVNSKDGRGNATLGLSYGKREPVLLGQRAFSLVGVSTASGAGLGGAPIPAPADCSGPNAVAAGNGSGTAIPTTIDLQTGEEFQFRNNGTLGATCSGFNFNPYNYFQTPNERYNALANIHYQISDHVEAYSQILFGSTQVRQQVAPSGVFFNTFDVPLANPFISSSARSTIIASLNSSKAKDPSLTMTDLGVIDANNNGVIDSADSVLLDIGRRTLELGERSTTYSNDTFQITLGFKGDLGDDWHWDASYQHGKAKRSQINAGYTNVVNIQNALRSTDGKTCANGQVTCVPINLFGGYGSITPAMAAYSSATAILDSVYEQTIVSASINGQLTAVKSPLASSPVAVALGTEYREEFGSTTPDECLKTPPVSCLGGAGGTTLPVSGGYSVRELFGEAQIPLIDDVTFAKNVNVELGYRYAVYDPSGTHGSWKAGLNWTVVDGLRLRVMRQKAIRVPNVGELAAPQTTGLDNAQIDPCSVANAANITAALRTICLSTGMTAAQVGVASNISAGQIGVFNGTIPGKEPSPEEADTTTYGFVWQPSFLDGFIKRPTLTVDYYNIDVKNTIGVIPAQEILDGCYTGAIPAYCALIVRGAAGNLKVAGAGVKQYNTNLVFQKAEGVELGASFGLPLSNLGFDDKFGSLNFSFNGNYYLDNSFKSSPIGKVTQCVGYFGTACGGPTHEYRWQQRTVWSVGDLELSYLWRHLGEVDIEKGQVAKTFKAFQHIKAYDYIDLSGSYDLTDSTQVTMSVANVFDKNPPIVGGQATSTAAGSGNTMPRNYDVLGRVYRASVRLRF